MLKSIESIKSMKMTMTYQYGERFNGMSLDMIISTHIAEAVSSKVFPVIAKDVNTWIFGGGFLDDTTEKYLNVISEAHDYDFESDFDEDNFRVFLNRLLKDEPFKSHFVDEAVKLILKDME